jgi:hypothetical protein
VCSGWRVAADSLVWRSLARDTTKTTCEGAHDHDSAMDTSPFTRRLARRLDRGHPGRNAEGSPVTPAELHRITQSSPALVARTAVTAALCGPSPSQPRPFPPPVAVTPTLPPPGLRAGAVSVTTAVSRARAPSRRPHPSVPANQTLPAIIASRWWTGWPRDRSDHWKSVMNYAVIVCPAGPTGVHATA